MLRHFSIAEYEQMGELGVVVESDRVELLDGWLVQKAVKTPAHRIATHVTRQSLDSALPGDCYVDTHQPLWLPEMNPGAGNVPEPDVSVVSGDFQDYSDRHPPAESVILGVEVSDTSLQHDRGLKKQIYAHARIPEYWIVNLVDHQLEVYQRPSGSGLKADYDVSRVLSLSDSVSIRVGNKSVGPIPVKSLFPKP